jgi:LysM repeat protein
MYIVKETVVPGWTASSPSEYSVELKASGSCSTTNFVNIQTHMIQDDPPKKPKDKAPPKNCPMYYTVKPGDTVWGISMWFGVPMNAIVRVNHLNNPSVIYPGTRLCIPLGDP